MIGPIRLELTRLLQRNEMIGCFFLIVASLYFTFQGIQEYQFMMEEQKIFASNETQKVTHYVSYFQYGVVGFRVIVRPSPLFVFFNHYSVIRNLESCVNNTENIPVYSNRKGSDGLRPAPRFGDLGQLISIFASLLAVGYGFFSFPDRAFNVFFGRSFSRKIILARLGLLGMTTGALFGINLLAAYLWGIRLHPRELTVFWLAALLGYLLLVFFFLGGLLLKSIFLCWKKGLLTALALWIFWVFLLPAMMNMASSHWMNQLPSSEKLSFEKWRVLLNSERKSREYVKKYANGNDVGDRAEYEKVVLELRKRYLSVEAAENRRKEFKHLDFIRGVAGKTMNLYAVSPMNFFSSFTSELAGTGHQAYAEFLFYVIRMQEGFLNFCFLHREDPLNPDLSRVTSVEPFIHNEENIFQPSVGIKLGQPGMVAGIVILLLYSLGLAVWIFVKGFHAEGRAEASAIPGYVKTGYMFFMLTHESKREGFYLGLKKNDWNGLDKNAHKLFKLSVKVGTLLRTACREKGLQWENVLHWLRGLEFKESLLKCKASALDKESAKKAVAALCFAAPGDIVLNDFLDGVSRHFEKSFLESLSVLSKMNRRVVYLCSHLYDTATSLAMTNIRIEGFELFQLDPVRISLR